jgi:DNA repair exonuclease SbcCD ATPase subunit
MQGPITVFDDGAYAGDAQIEDLPPGSERLLSYALDLKTEVASEAQQSPQQLVKCRLVKGVLHTSNKFERRRVYTVKNSGRNTKNVLVEYAYEPGWTLLAPKEPAEKTRDRYRFAVAAEPGKAAKLEVVEEMTTHEQVALTNLPDHTIRYYQNAAVVSDKVKAALAEVIKRKQQISESAGKKQQLEQQITAIDQEQTRIRQNMQQLDRDSDLYRRYVKKFGDQEDEVEKLRGKIDELAKELSQRQTDLDAYLADLNLE